MYIDTRIFARGGNGNAMLKRRLDKSPINDYIRRLRK